MASDEFIRLLMKLDITEENLTTRPKRKNKKEKKEMWYKRTRKYCKSTP